MGISQIADLIIITSAVIIVASMLGYTIGLLFTESVDALTRLWRKHHPKK